MVKISRLVSSRVSLARWLCTAAVEAEAPVVKVASAGRRQPLYRRLSTLGATGGTLNQCIREGKVLKKYMLDICIRELRKYRRYQHALEVFSLSLCGVVEIGEN